MAGKPRLAFLSPFLDKKHGTERREVELLNRIAGHYDIHLFSTRVEDVDLGRITWHRVPQIPGPHLLKYLWWLAANHFSRRRLRRRGMHFDLVISPGINCFDADVITVHVAFAQLLRQARPLLALRRSPFASWPRLLHRRLHYRLVAALERRIYTLEEVKIAAISRKTVVDLQQHFGRVRDVTIIYYGVDPGQFHPGVRGALRASARRSLNLHDHDFVLVLVGNGWLNKGLPCLLDALDRLANPRLRLLVVGRDDQSPFRDSLKRPALQGLVQFLPPRPDVEFYYAAADAYVGPSLEDAFSLPPLEAMACGVPTIVSRHAGVSEIVTHGEDALILEDPQDPVELAGLIEKLLKDSALRDALARQGHLTASRYTWDRNAEQMRAVIDAALESRVRP
jgi:UDP-glucose:(heptosyl)LPS alpha-1,3-glucosyltransferase